MDDSSTECTIRGVCYILVAFETQNNCGRFTIYQSVDGGGDL